MVLGIVTILAASSQFVVRVRNFSTIVRGLDVVTNVAASFDFVEFVFGVLFRLCVGFGLRFRLGFFVLFVVELGSTYKRVGFGLSLRFFVLGFHQPRRKR